MSALSREVAAHLAVTLMGLIDTAGPVEIGDGVAIDDVQFEEGDHSFGIVLVDGRTLEVEVYDTAPRPSVKR